MLSTPFLILQEASQVLRVKQEIDNKHKWKLTVELNRLYNYNARILRPKNNEIGEPELKNVG